jgi:hypothetical protein
LKADWKAIMTILLLVLLLGTAVGYLVVLHNDLTATRRDTATLHEDISVVRDILEPWSPGG